MVIGVFLCDPMIQAALSCASLESFNPALVDTFQLIYPKPDFLRINYNYEADPLNPTNFDLNATGQFSLATNKPRK